MDRYDATSVIDQLLRQDEAGLKAYVVLRLGGAEHLQAVYEGVREALARESGALTEAAPSLRAAAYAVARRLSRKQAASGSGESIAWLATADGRPPGYTEALDRVRSGLDALAAESLELRHARGLEVDEIRFVTESGASEVGVRLREAEASVSRWLADVKGAGVTIQTLVSDAFRPSLVADDNRAMQTDGPAPRLPHGTSIGGRFEIRSALEEGRAASSYLASDASVPGQSVVVQLFHRSAHTLAARSGAVRKLHRIDAVANPAVERNLSYGWHENRLWRATPRYAGHSLRDLVEERGLSTSEAIEVFAPVARGLGALHDQGVVHGDLSLERIWLVREGDDRTVPVLNGLEVWITGEGAGTATPAEDIHAFAVTLLHALEPTTRAATGGIAGDGIDVPASVRAGPFARLLRRALSARPDERPSGWDLAKELDVIEHGLATRNGRKTLNSVFVGLALVAALVGFIYFLREARVQVIRAARDGADAASLQSELDAERERSRQLELELQKASRPQP